MTNSLTVCHEERGHEAKRSEPIAPQSSTRTTTTSCSIGHQILTNHHKPIIPPQPTREHPTIRLKPASSNNQGQSRYIFNCHMSTVTPGRILKTPYTAYQVQHHPYGNTPVSWYMRLTISTHCYDCVFIKSPYWHHYCKVLVIS